MMGMGQALSEGTKYDDEGRQRNAALLEYKLQTMPDAPPITRQVGADQRHRRRAARLQGRRRGAQRRDRGGDRERARQAHRRAAAQAADDARARLGAHAGGRAHELHGSTHAGRGARGAGRAAPARSPAAPTSSSPPARASRRCPSSLVGIHGVDRRSAASRVDGGALVLGALVNHADIEASADDAWPAGRAWPTAARSSGSPATRNVGTIGGNVMNASPAMDTGAPLLVLGAEVELRSRAARARVAVASSGRAPARTSAEPTTSCRRRCACRRCRRARAAPTCGSSTAARWRSPSSAPRPPSRSTATATSRPAASR